MLQPASPYATTWVNDIRHVDAAAWNVMAKGLPTPFFEWEWLHHLEASGSASAQQGWLPHHLLLWRDRDLVAAAPLYVKAHSYGEFVFDHQWADLAHRLGMAYYPKLLGMAPFTPAEGYRFLVRPDLDNPSDRGVLFDLMVAEIDRFCRRQGISGCHFLYCDPQWRAEMETRGFTAWMHHSYIWSNQNYRSFDDYLQTFNANQRRNIKRERKAAANAGLKLRVYTGDDIPHFFYGFMYELYANTCDKFGWWGSKYLNRRFFEQLRADYRDRLAFVAAETEEGGNPLALSFCIRKGDRLYGRYWGCTREIDCLHFNACYYTPIEWAIAEGIQIFDPGAGGQHKKRRGFAATANFSLHRFYQPRLAQILIPHIHEVNAYERQQIEAINQELPFDLAPPPLSGSSAESRTNP